MARFLRFSLLFALVFALVWLGVIIWWQETNRVVSARDVALWMGLLPLVLIGIFFLLKAGYRWATAPVPEKLPAKDAPAAEAAPGFFAAQERAYSLAVIASGWSGLAGEGADAAAQALKGGAVEPKLESDIRDGDGLPALAAKHPGLDTESVAAWLATSAGNAVPSDARPRLLRMLALLEQALPPVLAELLPMFPHPADPHEPPTAQPRVLRLALVQPQDLDEAALPVIDSFIAEQIRAADLGPMQLQITPLPGLTDLPLVRVLDAFNVSANRDGLLDVLLLVGIDSALDEHTLEHYSARDLFYSAKRPQGHVPGEAAAVLALAAAIALPPSSAPLAQLSRTAAGLRDKPIDVRGRISDAMLGELATQALIASGVDASQCAAVFTDGGRSVPRTEELALCMTRLLPDLDVVADRIDLTAALGNLGAARAVSLLTLAAAEATAGQKPVLVAGLADARERFALLVTAAETASASA